MNSNSNFISDKSHILNTEIKNKGFAILDTMFKQHGWHMIKNDFNWRNCYYSSILLFCSLLLYFVL